MNSVKLVIMMDFDAEKTMGVHVARVSNPNNQEKPKVAGLSAKYCIKQMSTGPSLAQALPLSEIETTRGITVPNFRHRSFTCSRVFHNSGMLIVPCLLRIPLFDLRSQDTEQQDKDSIDDVDPFIKQELEMIYQASLKVVWTSIDRC